ncbi:protein kinase-like protein rad3 [Xylogone sp. PMI_703]|nr:protein kinase-like protein rad3 [Xylogone sp. PMI_703]
MAPTSRGATVKENTILRGGGAPGVDYHPPSTSAVQLINNLSTVTKPTRQLEQDDLQKLMSEVSSLENDASQFKDLDAKLEHQHKLIYVFTLAVLDRLPKDDPFMDVDQLVLQASEALDIFISIIKESPIILSYRVKLGSHMRSRGQEPFWTWLFPRVLILLGKRDCGILTVKISAFFTECFKVVSKLPKIWGLTTSFFCYLKECASTILSKVQNHDDGMHYNRAEFVLPSDSSDETLFQYHNGESNSPSLHCKYVLYSIGDGLWHVTNLLHMLVDVSVHSLEESHATSAFRDHLAWIFDSLLITHELWKTHHALILADRGFLKTIFSAALDLISSTVLREYMSDTMLRKGSGLLSLLCMEVVQDLSMSDTDVIHNASRSFLQLAFYSTRYDSIRRMVSLQLIPVIISRFESKGAQDVSDDFQKAAVVLLNICKVSLPNSLSEITSSSIEFEHESLDREYQSFNIEPSQDMNTSDDPAPAPKRRKIFNERNIFDQLLEDIFHLLGSNEIVSVRSLADAIDSYAQLDTSIRCRLIDRLGKLACASASTLTVERDGNGAIVSSRCNVCDTTSRTTSTSPSSGRSAHTDALLAMAKLIKLPAFLDSRKPRVLAMLALKRLASHFNDQEFIDLEVSILGQWCLQSLQSSIRELRITAGRTLPYFLNISPDEDRKIQYIYTRHASLLGVKISHDEELNIVLLKLVEYLGHPNPVISGVAFDEILKLARSKGVIVERLFSPYWASIAIVAVRELHTRPQISQMVADLLEITVPEFLILTQSYTLPWLVLAKKIDVINSICKAQQQNDPWDVCSEPSNLVPILSLLLVQNVQDIGRFASQQLQGVSSRFSELDFTELLRFERLPLGLHLLKAAADADDSKKSRVRAALQFLATHASHVSENENESGKKKNMVGSFLEQHILGYVAQLSEIVNDIREEHPMSEKKRCVKVVEEMVRVSKSRAGIARPQICACLQSALAQKELQPSAYSAWHAMLTSLEDDDVEMMLESTFSIIIQRWDTFDKTTRARVKDSLLYLLKSRVEPLRRAIVNLPSLSQFTELVEIDAQLSKLRIPTDTREAFQVFARRINHENPGVVSQAMAELKVYLRTHQSFLQTSAISDQPDLIIGQLIRSILDSCIKFNETHHDIATLAAECVGLIGCLDSHRVESLREQREMVVVSNFHDPSETTDFVLFILQEVIVKAFLSTTDTVQQGFLSYVMQELLEKSDFREHCGHVIMTGDHNYDNEIYRKWLRLPENVRATLTPFLTSKYALREMVKTTAEYPIFRPDRYRSGRIYNNWLKAFTLDLLQKPLNTNTTFIFPPLCRAIRIKDISVANFLLPYVALHVIVEGTEEQRQEIGRELLAVLEYQPTSDSNIKREDLKLCSEAVFRVLDYLSRWKQELLDDFSKRRNEKESKSSQYRNHGLSFSFSDNINEVSDRVDSVLDMIPAEIVSNRAVECKSYARALFYWEQYIRAVKDNASPNTTTTGLLERLQEIYSQIDEPDGIEGISAHLPVLNIEQQVLGHRKVGRWSAAQSWYEIKLAQEPEDHEAQVNLLTCMKESGQHDVLLNYIEGLQASPTFNTKILPYATEASWATEKWSALERYVSLAGKDLGEDFNVNIGRALLKLCKDDIPGFMSIVQATREQIACSLSPSITSSLGSFHEPMLKFHVLTELEMISGADKSDVSLQQVLESLDRRLEILGAYRNDKQYILGIRRATMRLSSLGFNTQDIASSWLTTAKIARKENSINQSFNAVLHASQLGDRSATIEHARLLWMEGQHRKAIQSLQGAINSDAFMSHNISIKITTLGNDEAAEQQQNLLTARAHLLLAKWQDSAGQTHSNAVRSQYQLAASKHRAWEKGHYYLGRHYNKLLESERALAPEQQAEVYLTGEMARLVIENYLRALLYGTKYIYQTLPRIITLWLDLGTQVTKPLDPKYGVGKEFVTKITNLRKEQLSLIHTRFTKYISRMPAYIFYTALPQIVARIAHPNTEVYNYLQQIIYKVVSAHPQHALWTLLAVSTSTQPERKHRGTLLLNALRNNSKKAAASDIDLKLMVKVGERLTAELLMLCTAGDFPGNRTIKASITNDLNFNHKVCTPSLLAVPIESVLTATLPTLTDNINNHKAFSREIITITGFQDEVLVLGSLQRPRKITARGSDGKDYGLLCKPKDDLRKDQRLMEFNGMINRLLKKDAESSRRKLYIKTYSVTPLNEECGLIEWVDGLKTLRDILISLYRPMGITPNYREIEMFCEEACKSNDKLPLFTEKVLSQFPPVFHLWFVQQFPEPAAWFAARLRYTRSCAVMSMVGTILGLGDRHGENILFEEGNGGTFHVDFNCLFDKGLTFQKPERVPFRLTHNMVDAMGAYGYEGPFRKSSELTLNLLRQNGETLMTILEAFIHDPTLDLIARKDKKKKGPVVGVGGVVVPTTAQGVLDSIQRKVKGLLPGESVPLSVEGQVDELIKQATNAKLLASMYIGWCAFF